MSAPSGPTLKALNAGPKGYADNSPSKKHRNLQNSPKALQDQQFHALAGTKSGRAESLTRQNSCFFWRKRTKPVRLEPLLVAQRLS